MKTIKGGSLQWLDKKGYSKKIILSPEELLSSGNLLQEIKIKPGETATEHFHKIQTEIFYFLTENGYWIINGQKYFFNTGDVLVIEPNDRHTVINESKNDYLYLAFKIRYAEDDIYWIA